MDLLAMSAADLLARTEAVGVTVEADRGWLLLTALVPASTGLMHDLAGAKAELLALLECRAAETAERAAIDAAPLLPTFGKPEQDRMDREQRAMVAGLLFVAGNGKPWKPRANP